MKDKVLTIEQMQELVVLGVDTSTASMCWFPMTLSDENNQPVTKSYFLGIHHNGCKLYWNTNDGREPIPTFTVHDILDMLPQGFYLEENTTSLDKKAFLQINKTTDGGYNIAYEQSWDEDGKLEIKMHGQQVNTSLLQAAFNMLIWCKQNHYM